MNRVVCDQCERILKDSTVPSVEDYIVVSFEGMRTLGKDMTEKQFCNWDCLGMYASKHMRKWQL